MAREFKFARLALPEPPAGTPLKTIRQVHPSLQKIRAWVSATGAAVCLADLDGDGKSNDMVQVDPRTDQLAVFPAPSTGNRYPRFTLDVQAPLVYDNNRMAPMGAFVSDVNEDGKTDVVAYYWGRTPVAFIQKTPTKYEAQELVPGKEAWNTSCGLASDFDGDGHLDLLFCNYFPDGDEVLNPEGKGVVWIQDSIARSFNGGKKHLLKWTPKGFVEQQNIFPDQINRAWTIAVGAADLDGDLLPEIYFANDTGPDRLMHNASCNGLVKFDLAEGKSSFSTPTSFVLGRDSFKGMGCDFGDMNHDAVPDIYVSNIAAPFGLEESHFLWLSNGDATSFASGVAPYRQASEDFGLSRSGWAWDCRLDDFNNDSILEAIQATGFLRGNINRWPELQSLGTSNNAMITDPRNWPSFGPGDDVNGHEKNCFFVKASNSQRYFDCAGDFSIADDTVSRGIAVGDIDADGKLDFAVANQWEPSFLYHNEGAGAGRFLSLRLLLPADKSASELKIQDGAVAAKSPASPAVGAQAVVHLPDGTTTLGTVDGGSGHSGKRAQELHFGLGEISSAAKVSVDLKWRDRNGKVQSQTVALEPGWHTIELRNGGKS